MTITVLDACAQKLGGHIDPESGNLHHPTTPDRRNPYSRELFGEIWQNAVESLTARGIKFRWNWWAHKTGFEDGLGAVVERQAPKGAGE